MAGAADVLQGVTLAVSRELFRRQLRLNVVDGLNPAGLLVRRVVDHVRTILERVSPCAGV